MITCYSVLNDFVKYDNLLVDTLFTIYHFFCSVDMLIMVLVLLIENTEASRSMKRTARTVID